MYNRFTYSYRLSAGEIKGKNTVRRITKPARRSTMAEKAFAPKTQDVVTYISNECLRINARHIMKESRLLERWFPEQSELTTTSITVSAGSALLAMLLVGIVSTYALSGIAAPALIASMGASSVLLFVVPTSTMSKSWAFIGGHLVSATIGVACYQLNHNILFAAPLAIAFAIMGMYYLRCMHPPGGATALLAVLGDESVHQLGFQFVLTPVASNLFILLAVATSCARLMAYHNEQTQKSTLEINPRRERDEWIAEHPLFTEQDLDHALSDMDTFIDLSRHDLTEIFSRALHHAHARDLGHVSCGELMSQPMLSVEYGSSLEEVWRLFEEHDIRGVAVTNRSGHLGGIVTVSDFVKHAEHYDHPTLQHPTLQQRLQHLYTPTPGFESEKPEVAGQIMQNPCISILAQQPCLEAIALFSQHRFHHLPVVDEKNRVLGMLTHEDIMAFRKQGLRTED
jgi:CBS domain-containing membrane protein